VGDAESWNDSCLERGHGRTAEVSMRVCSILALLVSISLAGCVVEGDDDDDDGVSDDDNGDDNNGDDNNDDDDNNGDDTGDDDDDNGDDNSGVEPRTGVWDYSDYSPEDNDCNIPSDYGNGGGGFGLVNNGDGSFTVIPNDDTDPFDCDLNGADFDCPDRATETEEVPGYDAVLVGQATAEGTFSDPENATGTQTAVINCEGGDCGLVELATGADFPCTFGVVFTVDWSGS
jgi:hypothetical protein